MKKLGYFSFLLILVMVYGCSEPAKVEGLKERISDHSQMNNGHRVMNTAYVGMIDKHHHFVSDLQADGDTAGLIGMEAAHRDVFIQHQEIERAHLATEEAHKHTLLEYKAGKLDDQAMNTKLEAMEKDHEKFMSDHEAMKKELDKIKGEHGGMEDKHHHDH